MKRGLTATGQEDTLGCDGNILYLDCGHGYTDVYVFQN